MRTKKFTAPLRPGVEGVVDTPAPLRVRLEGVVSRVRGRLGLRGFVVPLKF